MPNDLQQELCGQQGHKVAALWPLQLAPLLPHSACATACSLRCCARAALLRQQQRLDCLAEGWGELVVQLRLPGRPVNRQVQQPAHSGHGAETLLTNTRQAVAHQAGSCTPGRQADLHP